MITITIRREQKAKQLKKNQKKSNVQKGKAIKHY